MGEGEAEVRLRLVTDDAATITVEQLREALRGASEEQDHAKEHAKEMGNELFKAELYVEGLKKSVELVGEVLHISWEAAEKLGDAAGEAANEQNQQVRSMTGLATMMDRGAHSMEDVRDYTAQVREELAAAGTKAGMTTKEMTDMYSAIIERGAKSTEQAKELTEEMALVGKVVPRGAQGLAEGFNMMELGIIRARNPIVQLIAATHVLQGNAHAVAAQMQKMSPEKQVETATKAIELQAQAMRGPGGHVFTVPTLEELRASFSNLREGMLEGVGQPLLDHLLPVLGHVRDFLGENAEKIDGYAEMVGSKMGDFVDVVSATATDIYQGVVKNWSTASREFRDVFGEWRDAWDYATDHTEEIKSEFESVGKTIVEAFGTASRYAKATAEVMMDARDLASGADVGSTQSGIAEKAMMGAAAKFGEGADEQFDKMAETYRQKALSALPDVGHYVTNAEGDASAWVSDGKDPAAIARIEKEIAEQREFRQNEGGDVERFKGKTESQDTEGIAAQIDKAREIGDNSFLRFALGMIASSDSMTKALMDGDIAIKGGFEAFEETIDKDSPELAKKLKKIAADAIKGEGGIKGQGPTMNFFGGVHIKQDFRDQDPDRVIEVMRRDIYTAASSRKQARVVTPFGL